MNFTTEHKDKIAIFTIKETNISGEIAADLKAEMLIVCQPTIGALIIDLSKVEMIDSSGLGALLLAHRQLGEIDTPLILVGIHGMVQSLMTISQLDPLFNFADTLDIALDMLVDDEEED